MKQKYEYFTVATYANIVHNTQNTETVHKQIKKLNETCEGEMTEYWRFWFLS